MQFETYRKRGKHWEYLGERAASSSKSAALHTSYVHHLRVIGVRPAGANIPIDVVRLARPAELHHGV